MMRPDPQNLRNLLENIREVAVLLPKNPSYDAVAAALALKLSLDQSGKNTTLSCPDPMTVEFHRLVGVDNVTNNFGSRNLVISFPGQSDVVDKVTYTLEQNELRLVITPKANTSGLDHRKVKFISGGVQAELAIFVGVHDLTDLGQMYTDAQDFLQNIKQYYLKGEVLSDQVAYLINALSLPLNSDIASNLLAGIEKATNNFQIAVAPETFESAALLVRRGARRHDVIDAADFPAGSIPEQTSASDWLEPKIYKGTSVS